MTGRDLKEIKLPRSSDNTHRQSAIEEFGGGAELGKHEVRSKNYES